MAPCSVVFHAVKNIVKTYSLKSLCAPCTVQVVLVRTTGRNRTRVGVRIRISTQLRCVPKATASPKLEPRVLVEPGKWLVEHDHAAGVVHRPRQRHAALHAAGELGDGLVQAVRRENLAQLLGDLLAL